MRDFHCGDVCDLENHTHLAEDFSGGVYVVRYESRQALAFLYIGLKREDIDAAVGERAETPPERAGFILDGYRKFLGLRHLSFLPLEQRSYRKTSSGRRLKSSTYGHRQGGVTGTDRDRWVSPS